MSKEETVYTVAEIAEAWKLSTDKVQHLFLAAHFAGEPGIIALVGPKGRHKINRRTLRIAESARFRMWTKLQGRAA